MNLHLDTPPRHTGLPIDRATHVVIAVHGRNGTPDVVEALVARLGWSQVACLALTAANRSWYPERFLAPIERNQPWLDHALAALDACVQSVLAQGVPTDRIVLLGWSQGACLTAEYVVRHPARYAGVVLFTGGAIGPEGTTWPVRGSLAGTPVYLGTGDTDEWVPLFRVRETADVLRQMGGQVHERVLPARPHVVSDLEIRDVRELFAPAGLTAENIA